MASIQKTKQMSNSKIETKYKIASDDGKITLGLEIFHEQRTINITPPNGNYNFIFKASDPTVALVVGQMIVKSAELAIIELPAKLKLNSKK